MLLSAMVNIDSVKNIFRCHYIQYVGIDICNEKEIILKGMIYMKVIKHSFEQKKGYRTIIEHIALVESDSEITTEQVGDISKMCGWHPAGYGCYDETVEKSDVDNCYVVTWTGRNHSD